jgi:CelD/BcsL family acetyltransferase involved in cellulose biosynthesis
MRLATDPERLDDDLTTLFRLHAQRWSDGESSFVPRQAFHRAFAAEALARGWLRLAFLEVDGHPVAAAYDLRFGAAHSHYNSGRDPAWARASVGMILRMRTIRAALEEGALEYRYLRGDEAYKYRLATADPGVVTVARSRGARGGAALRAVLAAADRRRLRPMLGRFG